MDNQKSKLDKFFSNPAAAVAMAILCNILWGSALPFIKMGYRMFAIDSSDTATTISHEQNSKRVVIAMVPGHG